jgi:hypothetical protein
MKTTIELAREVGLEEAYSLQHNQFLVQFRNGSLERLVALARADEREACADAVRFADNGTEAAEIIRARGNT